MPRIGATGAGVLAAVLAGAAFLAPAPASAATFEFFEGNDCTQDLVYAVDAERYEQNYRAISFGPGGVPIPTVNLPNDEARSVRVSSNWRHRRERRRQEVDVYDTIGPGGADGDRRDDWARLVIDDATQIPVEGVCVGSFERNFDRSGVHLERHPHNGLDGKVSMIGLFCDAACRADLTPDPAVASEPRRPVVTGGPSPSRETGPLAGGRLDGSARPRPRGRP